MSVPSEVTPENKEKQDALSSKRDTVESFGETSCSKQLKKKRNDTNCIPAKNQILSKAFNDAKSLNQVHSNTDKSTDNNESNTDEKKDNAVLVARHYNSLHDRNDICRRKSRILHLKNFNNWIKCMLILEHLDAIKMHKRLGSPIKVLDLCCGKGGDLFKWQEARVSHVICVDLANLCIEQCQCRYNTMKNKNSNRRNSSLYTAEFITADCTKVRIRQKFKDPSIQLDLVSCQFALHYSFESLQQAENMMRNASENLKPGGYFIGSVPNAYELVSRWHKCDDNKFGNSIYNVEFLCDKKKPSLFGAKYNFYLTESVECPEFLVYFPVLCKVALKFGLQFVKFERFDDYYKRKKSEGRSLLCKMGSLETYPPNVGMSLTGPDEDYQHAADYMKTVLTHQKLGTLSRSEWDVISLYALFVFQKMKTVWNSEGKPEYVTL